MSQLRKSSMPIVASPAGFNSNYARLEVLKGCDNILRPHGFFPKGIAFFIKRIQVKNIFCQIDANNGSFCFGMGHIGSPNVESDNIIAQRLFSEAAQEQ